MVFYFRFWGRKCNIAELGAAASAIVIRKSDALVHDAGSCPQTDWLQNCTAKPVGAELDAHTSLTLSMKLVPGHWDAC